MLYLVVAVIKPSKLEQVKESLTELGVKGLTATEVKGFGNQGGQRETYRGAEYSVDFLPKTKIEVLTDGEITTQVVDTIAEVAGSGEIGDGKIWVIPLDRIVRIRTGETGADAL